MTESPQIQSLKARYRESLIEKSQIASQWSNTCKKGALVDAQVTELHGWLHQLAGSSGMYEYDQIAKLCRDAMGLVQEVPVSEQRINQALHQLSEVMMSAAHTS